MEFNATFLISAISFILFTIVMNKIFYKPLENIMNERQKFINDNILDAKYSSDRADAILKDREDKLNKSVLDSKKLISDRINEANKNFADLTEKAKLQSKEEAEAVKTNLLTQVKESEDELNKQVIELANVISSKVLGQDINKAERL